MKISFLPNYLPFQSKIHKIDELILIFNLKYKWEGIVKKMLKKMDSKERFLHLPDGENYKKLVIKIM